MKLRPLLFGILLVSVFAACKKDETPNTALPITNNPPTVDTVAPVLTISGGLNQSQSLPTVSGAGTWTFPTATAIDNFNGDISS
jgi:hypothetical protein